VLDGGGGFEFPFRHAPALTAKAITRSHFGRFYPSIVRFVSEFNFERWTDVFFVALSSEPFF